MVSNTDMTKSIPFGLTRFEYGSTHVSHMVLGNMVDDYEAPFASLKNGEGSWIPLEYSLLLLDGGLMITDDALLIDIPTKRIDDYFADVVRNSGRYDFDWADDFGYTKTDVTVIGSASHLVNVFSGALELDGASWVLLFQQFAGKMDSYDAKYGEKLALLLCTEADKELQATVDKVDLLVEILEEDGALGMMLSSKSSDLDSQIGDLSKRCEEVLRQVRGGNSPLISYNRSYQALEDAFDRQTWVSDLSNAAGKAAKFLDVASKAMEVSGFAREFKNQDEFSLAALTRCLGSSGGLGLPNKMEVSMAEYAQSLMRDQRIHDQAAFGESSRVVCGRSTHA